MKLSIITVCYNSEKFLKDCINSVNIQKLDDIEHIFIDGGSSDKTIEIIKKTSKRKTVLISEPDEGIYDAMNKGIKAASGDILCFLNSDDLFSSNNALAEIFKAFESSEKELIWGNVNLVNQNNLTKVNRVIKPGYLSRKNLLVGRVPFHPSFFITRRIVNEIGFYNLKYKVSADFDFMKRALIKANYEGCYIDITTSIMRSGGFSGQISNIIQGNKEIINSLKSSYSDFNLIWFIFAKFKQKITDYFRAL